MRGAIDGILEKGGSARFVNILSFMVIDSLLGVVGLLGGDPSEDGRRFHVNLLLKYID